VSETRHPALRTRACELFGVEYPVVQTGMGWVAGARLTAATSAAGGLGILASATMTFDELRKAVHEVKDRTSRPFGVNLRSDQPDVDDRIRLVADEGVRVASFAQAPGERLVKTLKDAGVVVMPTVGARRHAEKVAGWGVDAVIAQGGEGGGHTGTVPTSLLLPQVVDAVDIPVLGAGGFFDGRGLVAALAYGAAGIAMGTRFLLTRESTVPDAVKQVYLDTPVTGTVVTTAVDGHPQRVIRTEVIEHLAGAGRLTALPRALRNALAFRKLTGTSVRALAEEGLAMRRSQDLSWAQLAMAANAPMLTKAAMVDGRLDAGILPTGQVVGLVDELPTVEDVVHRVVEEASAVLERLTAPPGADRGR
jgi:NAD(P)H-dependent flavin oxidoreductase YrpB (nitropropane dioxygenase family)